MKINVTLHSSHFSCVSVLANLAMAMTCTGCNAEPRIEIVEPSTTFSDDAGINEGDIQTGLVEDPHPQSDENLCGVTELGVDSDGIRMAHEERYNFARMNFKLAAYPMLQAATGLTNVSGCEDARAFIRGYNQYRIDHPEFVETFYSDRPLVVVPRSDTEVSKIYQGTTLSPGIYDLNTMGLQAATKHNDIPKGYVCSAVRLSPNLLLTAAHCVPTPNSTTDTVVEYQIWIRRATASTADFFRVAAGTKIVFHTKSQQSPNYTGEGDYNNDLALIYIPYKEQAKMRRTSDEISAYNSISVFIGTKTPAANDLQTLNSWGPTTLRNSDPGISKWQQNTASDTIETVVASKTAWTIQASSNSVQMCEGDSGSGALRDGLYLDGIASIIEKPNGVAMFEGCANGGATQYWTDVNQTGTVNWLDWFFYNIQDIPGKQYYCGFVPGIGDPGTYDPQISTAFYYCGFSE